MKEAIDILLCTTMKLVVEVLDASDLMPKDGINGSSNPYVEVEFDQQLHRTETKFKDLNPVWNETLVFNVSDPSNLPYQTVQVVVYSNRNASPQRNFLGRVRISGSSIPLAESETVALRYPLDKRGLFSHIRGDIALKLYAVMSDHPWGSAQPPTSTTCDPEGESNKKRNEGIESKKKNKKKKREADESNDHISPNSLFELINGTKPLMEEMGGGVMSRVQHFYSRAPVIPQESGKEDRKRMGLVDEMEYLYVKVEKARDLPAGIDLDPYVEVKIGNYKGVTQCMEKNQNPVWNQVFSFPKERLQANRVEVVVKDQRDVLKDEWVGRISIDLDEVPRRVPPDGPLASSWHKLEDKNGEKAEKGEVMIAVWMGTQADHYFPETIHADFHSLSPEAIPHTRSGVYHSPNLFYLRLHIIQAQDLVPSSHILHPPDTWVKVEFTPNQVKYTRPSTQRSHNPIWNEELMFIASEPLSDQELIITVEERVGPNKREAIGRVALNLSQVATVRSDHHKQVDPQWFNLSKADTDEENKIETKFASKIHLCVCLEGGYHVLDESTHYSSDLQASDKHLWRPSVGVLEVGILGAVNLLPVKAKEGRPGSVDSYCVAKYGSKWVRTRTRLDTLAPSWNEQYTWEVSDPCTVITLAVFDNWRIMSHESKNKSTSVDDRPLGKAYVRLSTLETGRVYVDSYPLMLIQPSGVKAAGELRVALRFTCTTSWLNMAALYAKPLLPKMHYLHPIPLIHLDLLRRHAVQIVGFKLARSEPPLRPEVVAYILDVEHHMWSLRRSKANFDRLSRLALALAAFSNLFEDVRDWKKPLITCLVHLMFFILVCYPRLILPTVFLYLFLIGMRNYRLRPKGLPHLDPKLSWANPDELDEEFDTFPTTRAPEVVRMRYDRLRSVAGRVQSVVGDLATQGERAGAILNWRDSRATGIFVIFSLVLAFLLYVTPFQVVLVLVGLYVLRHPRFRAKKMPSVSVNFFKRLPAKSDLLL